MSDRLDLYAPVHKAVRHCMQSTLIRLGRMDVGDHEDVRDSIAQVREMIALLAVHLEIENTFVHPALLARCPGGLGNLVDDHEHHERAFVVILRDADALERAASEPESARRGRAHRLYLDVSRFVAENLIHMTVEETEINPLLWKLFTDAELNALLQQILAIERPENVARTTRWLIPALAPAERAQTVIGARHGLPAPVFDQVLAMVESLISASDWQKLTTALAAA